MARPGDTIQVEAARLGADGRGEGIAGGLSVRVADLLPGERAEVAIEHESPHRPVAWGRIARRLGPRSPERQAPACPAFGRCGGCPWQHLAYQAQLREKRARAAKLLSDLGGPAPEVRGAPAELGYRNRGNYVIGDAGGRLVLGAYEPRSHRVVDTGGCRAVEPAIDRGARRVRAALERSGLPVYDERAGKGLLRYAVVRANAAGALLVGLVTRAEAPRAALASIAGELLSDDSIGGVVWIRNDATSSRILTGDRELLAGRETLSEEVAGVPIEVDVGAFLQVNRRQADRLYAELASWVAERGAARALELYCGVGGIALSLARAGIETEGIERDPGAVEAARRAAEGAGLGDRARFRAARASELSPGGSFDLVVVDPPRKGLDAETRAALLALAPPALAYVSCNPDTFARDLRELRAAGYAIERAVAYDFMPGTPQLELMALLSAPR